jgi:phage tail-like protein
MSNAAERPANLSGTGSTFIFEIDGIEIGRFTEVEGLELKVEVYRHEEGGANGHVHELPGRVDWPHITLRGGLTKANTLERWIYNTVGEGAAKNGYKLERSSGAITWMAADGTRVRSWEFEGAFPVRWRGPRFTVHETTLPTEEIEISHRGFRARDMSS